MRWSDAALAAGLAGCAGPAPSLLPPELLGDPVIVQPVDEAPLVRRVSLSFDRAVTVEGTATDGRHVIEVRTEPSPTPSFPLIGLYFDTTWTVDLVATDGWGQRRALDPITFTTAPPPDPWPRIDLLASEPDAEPGFTLVPLMQGDRPGYLVALDPAGEVAWLWNSPSKWLEARVWDDGHLRAGISETILVELDWEGVTRRLLVIAAGDGELGTVMPDVPVTHHELLLEDDGSWVTLTREPVQAEAYPLSYVDPALVGPAALSGDRIVRVDPESGEVLQDWSVSAVMQTDRLGYDGLSGSTFGRDWTHTNSVQPLGDDQWLVSVKHQDAVVAMDRATGELDWILANPAGWDAAHEALRLRPVGEPFAWPWHQHAAKWLGDGRVLLFDNGNYGAAPLTGDLPVPTTEARSRVVQYRVDPVARTVEQEWEYLPEPRLYSTAMGDVDALPGGSVLADFARIQLIDGAWVPSLGWGATGVELREFEPATGRLLWGVQVWGEGVEWRSYRAQRFSSFGPGGVER